MDSKEFIELKRKPFLERLDSIENFIETEKKNGNLWGRVGIPPVDYEQYYSDPLTNEYHKLLNFGSNSYLGLANEPEVKEKVKKAIDKYGLGTGGSPAFSGYMKTQQDTEAKLAKLSDHETSLILAGGYVANLAWTTGLIGKDDVVIFDKNSHASVIDGMKLAGVTHAFSYDTEQVEVLDELIKRSISRYPDSHIFLTVEGVRSIDGSVSNLEKIINIARPYGNKIFVMLDDAHGLGTLGKKGHGTLEYLNLKGKVDLRMSTCSKAMGIQGAFLTGSYKVIRYIKELSNAFTFTTAVSTPVIAAIDAALDFMEEHPERLQQLHINKKMMQDGLEDLQFKIYRAPSGIIPIFFPNKPVDKINRFLFDQGIFVNAMSYPMISPGQERIRISMMATQTKKNIENALSVFAKVKNKFEL